MLKSIFIRNFALLSQAEIDLEPGFTVFTGETGAGKSILVGALSQVLGDRAAVKNIRHGADMAEIVAAFDIRQHNSARKWLQAQEITTEDNELVIRRVIRRDGKSRLWINHTPATVAAVRELARQLVQIHGQHDHMRLTDTREQRRILDEYGDYNTVLAATATAAEQWKHTEEQWRKLQSAGALTEEQAQLLRYQLAELDELALEAGELDALHQEHQQLSHAVDLIQTVNQTMDALVEGDHAIDGHLTQVIGRLNQAVGMDFSAISQTLEEAVINVEEAAADLRRIQGQLKTDPQRLQDIEQRLDRIHHMARKHKVAAELLPQHHAEIAEKLQQYAQLDEKRQALQEDLEKQQKVYAQVAAELTRARKKAAEKLAAAIQEEVRKLGLHARVAIQIEVTEADIPRPEGLDRVEFCITTNPGQPPMPLKETASGGELSRIALAIEVQRRHRDEAVTFVFDEVDSGVGGAVAEKIGQLLRALAGQHQVLAVTHLPQVAGQAHHHIKIDKTTDGERTHSHWRTLDTNARIQELARMTGGETITEATLAQAREFLAETP